MKARDNFHLSPLNSQFKMTEVGLIPEDWEVEALGSIAAVATGSTPSTREPSNYGDEYLFVSPVDMGRTKYITRSETMLSAKGFTVARHFPEGSVLFVCIGSTIGKCGIAREELTSNQQINAILPTSTVSSEFLYYALSAVAPSIKSLAGEQAVPIVNKSAFAASVIPLPPTKAEQQAIAEALSDADALIESLEQLLAKKRQIKQGAMQELLTGKRRLPGFGGEWVSKPIGGEIDLLTGFPFPSRSYSSDGVRLLRGSNIKRGVTDWDNDITKFWPSISSEYGQFGLRVGDIVVAMDGSLVGRSFARLSKADLPALLLQRVARIRSKTIDMGYLKEHICSVYFTEHCDSVKTVTAIPHISPNNIRDFVIPVPPSREEQTAIASILSDMDAEIVALEEKLEKARRIKQGMMQELLTGRIRLV